MPGSFIGINDDDSDDILARDAVLMSTMSPDFSGVLAQGGVWPPAADSRLIIQRRGDRLLIVPVKVSRSVLETLRPVLETLRPVIERVAELVALPGGWNSYDASPVSATAMHRTLEFLLEHVTPGVDRPDVVPTVRGGLQLEWHNNGLDVEVEIASDGPVSLFMEDTTTGETTEMKLIGNEQRMRRWLTRASG